MTTSQPIISTESARRLLMGAQGLLSDPGRRASPINLEQTIEQMGFVQLDSINVVERAHHLTLASRFDDYLHEHFAHLLEKDRRLFEHWTHDASAIPTKWFAYWKPRFARYREHMSLHTWWQQRIGDNAERVIHYVRERINREGPLRSQDFEHERRPSASSAWWGWKPQKAALEFLWWTGELMVTRRVNFHKVYDLTERVLPEHYQCPQPPEEEYVEWACSTALERLGVATPKEVADFWKSISLAQAKAWCEETALQQRITPIQVESMNGEKLRPAYAVSDWEQRLKRLPEPPERMRLLSPFDPVLRDRARVKRLFGFDYRFEAFVPEQKRQYGYYVLPMLEGDRLVGRVDPKFHRARGVLEIRGVYWEPRIRPTQLRRRKLDEALMRLARMVSARQIERVK